MDELDPDEVARFHDGMVSSGVETEEDVDAVLYGRLVAAGSVSGQRGTDLDGAGNA
ncbi:MAG: hypothetical protein ABEJ42_05600 [Halobacteriaceae archaeon]